MCVAPIGYTMKCTMMCIENAAELPIDAQCRLILRVWRSWLLRQLLVFLSETPMGRVIAER